jgi:membrane protease YdiL (CAAX protease family)
MAVVPYLDVVLHTSFATHPLKLPLPILALLQGLTNFSIAASLGILFARKIGIGAPLLEAWLYRGRVVIPWQSLVVSCVSGLSLGLITLLLIHSPLGAALSNLPVVSENAIPLWKRLLACLYGGLCEEIVMRLFLLSLAIWALSKAFKRVSRGEIVTFWFANVVVALAFGAGHLPLAYQLAPLTMELVTVVVGLNAFVSMGFGYLYWSRGLEAAIIAHFSTDIVLHVIGPLCFR